MPAKYRPVKALWPDLHLKDKRLLPLWAAIVIALSIEVAPFVGKYLYGLWDPQAFLEEDLEELPDIKMTVRLDERPPPDMPQQRPPEPEPEEEVPDPDLEEIKNTIPLIEPRRLPNEVEATIALVQPKVEEDEEPPLPSVFQDAKPVRKKPFPKYPREAEDNMIEGDITVLITVSVDGRVMDVQVVSANPAGIFDQEVLGKVRQWKFKKDGTQYEVEQKFIFKIDPWAKS
ncbi:MAG: energy transducer TonB [Burkholderiales bacterium]|jgi:TonB family protein|nr:energy transducer TonB [Betaproteobacteria bacterium]MBT7997774.1 energy transducer TonB [Betaproteobacteria bacterium]MDG1162904.1 energy transducer TonB [Burkholderiales bacterium]MDG1226201.1 energy transducer TonB [Burkholderiales bacterium]MDG2202632.1 energy transducer TonB [Burkholderiales bacterium]